MIKRPNIKKKAAVVKQLFIACMAFNTDVTYLQSN